MTDSIFVKVQGRKRNNYFGKKPVKFSGRDVYLESIHKIDANELQGICLQGGRKVWLFETYLTQKERNIRYNELLESIK